jgi:hypothetical protein
MGFFDDVRLPLPPEPEEEPPQPEWFGPPEDWIGGAVPLELVIGRSEEAAAYLTGLVTYPMGFAFTIHVVTRAPTNLGLDAFDHAPYRPDQAADRGPPPELLRYGIEYPDGRRATSVGEFIQGSSRTMASVGPDAPMPDSDNDLLLTTAGGSGGARHSEQQCWVWPLPPSDGEVRFVCEWPRFQIPESSVGIDAARIHEAASRATAVWE